MRISPDVRINRSGSGELAVVEAGCEQLFIHAQGIEASFAAGGLDDAVDGVQNFGAAAVVDGQIHAQTTVAGSGLDYGFQFAAHRIRKRFQPANGLQPDVVLLQFRQFLLQVKAQQAPQGFDFGARALPVLDRESVERQDADSHARAGLDRAAYRSHTRAVPGDAWQAAAFGPAAVAVHYDGDVRGQSGGIDGIRQLQVRITGPERFQQVFHEVNPYGTPRFRTAATRERELSQCSITILKYSDILRTLSHQNE